MTETALDRRRICRYMKALKYGTLAWLVQVQPGHLGIKSTRLT